MHKKRKISRSGFYHIVIKGNNGAYIFSDDKDKKYYLDSLFKISKEENVRLIAWCIMDNHVHISAKIKYETFSRFLRRLNVTYSRYYTRNKSFTGHVFQEVKDFPLNRDEDIINNLRYIHNNPLEAGMVKDAREYKFSSYKYYISDVLSEDMREIKKIIAVDNEGFIDFHFWNSEKIKI